MIQALDLARENAVLKDEVDRLRRTVARLVRDGEISPAGTLPDEVDLQGSTSPVADARLVLVMPRCVASDRGTVTERLSATPRCEIIVDRRVRERRRGQVAPRVPERRRGERRASEGETPSALVVSVVPVEAGRAR